MVRPRGDEERVTEGTRDAGRAAGETRRGERMKLGAVFWLPFPK